MTEGTWGVEVEVKGRGGGRMAYPLGGCHLPEGVSESTWKWEVEGGPMPVGRFSASTW